jgi:hypothetical protein
MTASTRYSRISPAAPSRTQQERSTYTPRTHHATHVTARSNSSEQDVDLAVNRRFFFAHHQGYQVYFFEPDSPAVFMYTEGDEEPQKLAEDFLDYLWAKVTPSAHWLARAEHLPRPWYGSARPYALTCSSGASW